MPITVGNKPANALPTGDYVNQVTTGQSFAAGDVKSGNEYTAGELLNAQVGTGIYMFPILRKQFKHLEYVLFDWNKPGQKNLKSKFLPIDATITTDGVSLTWYDYNMFDVETTIGTTAASNAVLAVDKTAGYEVGDTIYITRAPGSAKENEKRTVTAITADTSITVNSAIAVDAGDKIVRAYYVQQARSEVNRGSSTWGYTEFKSFFQRFGRSIQFDKSQLNRTYFFEASAQEYIASVFGHNMNILLQEFNKALYLGGNVPGDKSEMLGIDTAITKQAATDPSLIVDFASITDDDEKVEKLMEVIEATGASGATAATDTITVMVNRKFASALGRLKKEDIVYNDALKEIDFNIITLKNMFGQVEFVHDPMLDDLFQSSVAYMIPRSLMTLKFRQHQRLTGENGAMEAAKGEISLREKIHNIPDVSEFYMYFEAAVILGGLTSGAYRKLVNFA